MRVPSDAELMHNPLAMMAQQQEMMAQRQEITHKMFEATTLKDLRLDAVGRLITV